MRLVLRRKKEKSFYLKSLKISKGVCRSAEVKINEKIKRLQLTVHDLINMTEEQIRERFKDSSFIMKLKNESKETIDMEKINDFMSKYLKCPKCKIPIEKIEGYKKF